MLPCIVSFDTYNMRFNKSKSFGDVIGDPIETVKVFLEFLLPESK